jgi:hypothetical protein
MPAPITSNAVLTGFNRFSPNTNSNPETIISPKEYGIARIALAKPFMNPPSGENALLKFPVNNSNPAVTNVPIRGMPFIPVATTFNAEPNFDAADDAAEAVEEAADEISLPLLDAKLEMAFPADDAAEDNRLPVFAAPFLIALPAEDRKLLKREVPVAVPEVNPLKAS